MTFKKVGGTRNFGYGRKPHFAARCVLRDVYGEGRFGTRKTLESRISGFIAYMRLQWINDFCLVTRSHVVDYGEWLRLRALSGDLTINTATNYLSAVNCVMAAFRTDRRVCVSPRQVLGPRLFVRADVPETLDLAVVEAASLHLESNGEFRLAGVLRLCRVFGLRFREGCLLDVRQALREAKGKAKISIVRGTKGGRQRNVAVGPVGIEVLRKLARAIGSGHNVVPTDWTYIKWSRYCYRTWRVYADELGITNKFKELRTAFACNLYESVTGELAPVLAGGRVADRELDRRARIVVASALGHSREQIAAAYVGTSVRVRK